MILGNIKNLSNFRRDHYNAVALGGSGNCKVMLVCLEAGQFIPVHQPGIDLCLIVLEGRGMLYDGQTEQMGEPGDLLYARAGESRGIMADSRLVALAIVTPPPGPQDHEQVEQMLTQGRWHDANTDQIRAHA
ncbi:MAG: cupin [Phycisphaerales bacterium]|nr:cupin [Phycisphaerales bacterium]